MFIAQKPCTFAGEKFLIGDEIPANMVAPTAIKRLTTNGVIAEVGKAGPLLPATTSIETVEVPIVAEEGVTSVEMTLPELLKAIETVQKTDEEILEDASKITDGDILVFIDVMTDCRLHEQLAIIANPDKKTYTENGLMKMNKDELRAIAESYGMEVGEDDTKQMMADFILSTQGSDE